MQLAKDKPSLIIVCGSPRSGTSWLGKLFDSHPQTLYRHEPDSLEHLPWLPLFVENDYEQYAERLGEFVSHLPRVRAPKVAASFPIFAKAYMKPAKQFLVRQSLYLVKALSSAGVEMQVPTCCLPQANEDYVVVWKTVDSSGRLKLCAEVLPRKRILYLLRHPGGIVASQLRGMKLNKFNKNDRADEDYDVFRMLLHTAAGQRYSLTLDDIKAMPPIERLTWRYLVNMEKALGDLQGRPDCRAVVYEELCARPSEVMQELLDFCGLDFDTQTQAFLAQSTGKVKEGYYSVFKDPAESAYKWKKELSPSEQQAVQRQLERSSMASLWPE